MAFKFSNRSKERLATTHPDIQAVMNRAIEITDLDFAVLEGIRTSERQRELVNSGASQTMNSRHLTGHAIDIAPYANGAISWDWPLYYRLEKIVKQAAKDVAVELEWGGDWATFKDGPHWQLPWNKYPKTHDHLTAKPLSYITEAVKAAKPPVASTDYYKELDDLRGEVASLKKELEAAMLIVKSQAKTIGAIKMALNVD